MDLIEAEDIEMWQEYTKELYKKDFHNPGNHDGVIPHLEPDILKCEVKWALGSSKSAKIWMNKNGRMLAAAEAQKWVYDVYTHLFMFYLKIFFKCEKE